MTENRLLGNWRKRHLVFKFFFFFSNQFSSVLKRPDSLELYFHDTNQKSFKFLEPIHNYDAVVTIQTTRTNIFYVSNEWRLLPKFLRSFLYFKWTWGEVLRVTKTQSGDIGWQIYGSGGSMSFCDPEHEAVYTFFFFLMNRFHLPPIF